MLATQVTWKDRNKDANDKKTEEVKVTLGEEE